MKSISNVQRDSAWFKKRRSEFLRKLLGPRPRPQKLAATEVGVSRPQFRWSDNFHLLSGRFRYEHVDNDTGSGTTLLRIRDVNGVWHQLSFCGCVQTGSRVQAWRTQAIRDTMGGFDMVFGGKGFKLEDGDVDILEAAILAYQQTQDPTLPLQDHMSKLQQDVSSKIHHFSLRLNIGGPNFCDYLLSIISSGIYPVLKEAFLGLQWAERRYIPSHRDRQELIYGLVALEIEKDEQTVGWAARCIYRAWRAYCNMFLDFTLRRFRWQALRNHVIRRRLER
ncbi:hypothetical protein F4861DRAFT_536442 [Xylaria intraflava]|nr:hypothetical protein F4861DRAFT_536442 [Xylaria intraflava]